MPFIAGLLVLSFIVYTAFQLISFPDDGIGGMDTNGVITSLDPVGPSIDRLHVGDKILSIDGKTFSQSLFSYRGKAIGDEIHLMVERKVKQGEVETVETIPVLILLGAPSESLLLDRLVAVLVAFVFWGVGMGIDAFKPAERGSSIYSMWFYVSALTLTAGAASTMRLPWSVNLFRSLLLILGVVSVHFHTLFPQQISWPWTKNMLRLLYIIALVGLIPYLVISFINPEFLSWYEAYRTASLLFFTVNLLIVVNLLVYSYRHASSPGARGKIRLVLLGGSLVAIPFITLTILPSVLSEKPLVSYSVAFLLLGLLPLTYAYAIFRLHLIEIEEKINRGATFILVYSILGSFYLILYYILKNLPVETNPTTTSLINTVLVLVLATVFIPLHRWVQRIVDRIFYGGWYDYRLGVRQITENLAQITDLHEMARLVSERLVSTLRLEEAVIFFRDPHGDFSVIESSFSGGVKEREPREFPVLPRSSLTYLLKIGAVERTALLQALSQATLTSEELQLLKTEQIHLWVPVIGHGQIEGLLALGPKMGGDVFSGEDLDILRVVVQQLSPMIENIHLLIDLKRYAGELEKRVAERTAELYDAKERVEAILASVGDGVIVTDLDGCIVILNLAFERLSGFAADEIQGANLFKWLMEENGAPRIAMIQDALNNGEVWSDELIGRRKNGSQYNIQFTIAPIHDPEGKSVGYVSSLTDITRQKELDQMKDIFISDVSHELRTPITNISLYVELLKSAPEERRTRYLDVLKEQSLVLTKLVEDILDLSRLTASKSRPIVFIPADLNLLVEQVIAAHAPLAEAAGLSLAFKPDRSLPMPPVEQNQIARLITNLVANAIRYTPKGGVEVNTFCKEGLTCIQVKDTGLGIDQDDMPHIFERFFRGSNVRQSEIHGTGLGLAIVKEIVDFHGGTIEVQSERGKGSTFRVYLPITQN